LVRRERNWSGLPSRAEIRKIVERVLDLQKIPASCSISLFFCGDSAIRTLNKQYRGISRPTDVLSFAGGILDPEDARLHLGEVVISVPRAREQAADSSHPLGSEIRLLLVHGVLHLLGFDHDTPFRKKRMWAAQRKALLPRNPGAAPRKPLRRRKPASGGSCTHKKRAT
jgi:probable rRNA maturation factor